jgi:molecular chaperone HscB
MRSFFKIFSLPEIFAIDLSDLEKKYLQFQNEFHPDKSSSSDIEMSIQVNEGYRILSNDFLRACHLLALKKIDILNDENAVKADISTLEEIIELQEKIAEISDKNEINSLKKNLNSAIKDLILKSMNALNNNEIKASSQFLVKAKYLKKSLIDLKNKN